MSESGTSMYDELVELLGERTALRLCQDFGGRSAYVPIEPDDSNPLTRSIGAEGARAMFARYGNGYLPIPLGPTANPRRQRRLIRDLLDQGLSHSAIAARLHVHQRTVERISARRDQRQQDLFSEG